MATDIQGWVEIYDAEDNLWDGVIAASSLMERDYRVFGILFGVRGRPNDIAAAVANARGIPENISPQLKAELTAWEHIVSPSWITWEEIQPIDWNALQCQLWPDWKLLFELMSLIAQRYGAKNTRLVVWFDC